MMLCWDAPKQIGPIRTRAISAIERHCRAEGKGIGGYATKRPVAVLVEHDGTAKLWLLDENLRDEVAAFIGKSG